MYLTKQQIVEAEDRRYVDVDVPEWGGKVRLQSWDADQSLKQEQLLKAVEHGTGKTNPLASMLAASIVDENGVQVFTDKDLAALGKKSPAALSRLLSALKDLNRISEDAKGNSEATPAVA